MQVGTLIQRVQSLYSKGAQSDDSRLTRRHIYNKLLTVRSTLVFNKLNKRQYISQWNFQTLPCVELILVEGNDCPCFVPIGCQILRSKEKLPKPINSLSNHHLQSVTSIDGSIIFSETSWRGKNWSVDDKYTGATPDYFIKDNYIYITVTRKLKAITIIGLFNDPVEVDNMPMACDDETVSPICSNSPMDVEFNIDEDLIDTLIELAVRELVLLFTQMTEDVVNDSIDNSVRINRGHNRGYGSNE